VENQTSNKEIFALGLRLLIITAVAGFILGFANKITSEPIAKQQKMENDAAMQEVLPSAEAFNQKEVTLPDGSIIKEVNEGTKGSDVIGYAIKVSPKGYGGLISMMVGISNEGKVEGIKILSHSETPGLGANAPKEDFSGQFKGKPIEKSLEVVKSDVSADNQIKALTGATITSKGVTKGVNDAIDFYNKELKGGK
jgi:electron transport complex protein RnfG